MATSHPTTVMHFTQIGTLWFLTHHPMVTNGKAVNPNEMHQMEYGNTLCNMIVAKAIANDIGMLQFLVLDKGINKTLATNKASKNHTTPMLKVPHGVVGPKTSAQNTDSALPITGFQLSCLANTISASHATMSNWVKTKGQNNLFAYFLN